MDGHFSVAVETPAPRRRPSAKRQWRRMLAVPAASAAAAAVVLLLFNNAVMLNQLEVHDEAELDEYQFLNLRRNGPSSRTDRSKDAAVHIALPPSWTAPSAPALVATPCSTVTSSSGGGGGGGGGSGSSTPPLARRRRNPMADSAAVITIGGAMRLTVLTESVVRIEHRGYGVRPAPFDDRATFAIVNRRLKVPHFRAELGTCELLRGKSSRCLVVQTARLRLEHAAPQNATQLRVGNGGRGKGSDDEGWVADWSPAPLSGETLRVRVRMQPWAGGSEDVVEWWPGKPNPRQLTGTVRTLDNAEGKDAVTIFTEAAMRCDALPAGMQSGMKDDAHCAMGVISRDGWAVLDDTTTGRFDGSSSRGGWDWVSPRDAAEAAAERAALQADGDVRCTGWARSGECEANPDFMRSSCKAACEREAARRQQATAIGEGVQRRVDWYLFGAGLDFKGALRDLSLLSGEQPIPPRYAFGVWFSRWWPYADWESRALLKEFDARGVPCDVLITDMDWHHTCYRRTYGKEDEKSMDASHNWPCWSGFTFDRKYFANPESFLGWCKARGVHNGFNLHFQSGLVKAEEAAEHWTAFSRAMGLPPSAEFAAFDPLNMSYSSHFHTHVLAPLERKGVDFWWLDWQQGEGLFGSSDVPEANPTWWLNYVYGTQPDGREKRAVGTHTNTGTSTGTGTGTGSGGVRGGMGGGAGGDREDGDQPAAPSGGGAAAGGEVAGPVALPLRRRMIMHRWGGVGNQRYPIGFSGDTASSWASLSFQPHFTSSAANVNFGYWSHDVGGFYEPCEPELYVRWIQFGVLSPIFRSHGFRATNIEKRFWLFGDQYFVPMRAALRLRLELVPHLYTAARAAYDGAPSPIRPLYHEWPTFEASYAHPNQYLFGHGLVVAPVTKRSDTDAPLARAVQVWVPPGRWVFMASGLAVDGPRTVSGAFALGEIPILVADGVWVFGATPIDAEWDHCSAGTRGWLGRAQRVPRCPQASLWLPSLGEATSTKASHTLSGGGPGGAPSGSAELYEDDGWSNRYVYDTGATAWTTLSWRAIGSGDDGALSAASVELRVSLGAARGCLHSQPSGVPAEPGQPAGCRAGGAESGGGCDSSGRRSWRLLLYGIPPPLSASLRRLTPQTGGEAISSNGSSTRIITARGGKPLDGERDGDARSHATGAASLRFVDPPLAEMRQRSDDRSEHVWLIEPDRLCVVLWLFDLPTSESHEISLMLDRRGVSLAARGMLPLLPLEGGVQVAKRGKEARGMMGAAGAMQRAQAAKGLLDATYPETQPQDYDKTTWLAGLGSRLAARPGNYSRELAALPALLSAARAQLRAEAGRRVSSPINTERVRNATALLEETGVW